MGTEDGWAAVHLEMPARVPRTEYSAHCYHWPLVRAVTGIEVDADSPPEAKGEAGRAFMRAWDYGFQWSIAVTRAVFGEMHSSMGHAAYAEGGTDIVEERSQLFEDPEDALAFDPLASLPACDEAAWTETFNTAYRNQRAHLPGVPTTGIYITLVSGLIDLFGWETLLAAAGLDPERFGEVASRYARWIEPYFHALARSEAPVVMIHDDMVWTSGPFIAPEWYRTYIFPNLRRLLDPLREAGKIIAFTSDGDFTLFVDDLVEAGVNGFCLEPMTDMAYIAERYGKTHFFIGNADTRILLSGDRAAIRAEVERCMRIGKDCPGFLLAVGNHIPYNTPVENALYYNECYMEMRER